MEDIRIKFSLIGHPKLEKLKYLIGDQALERLVTLWIRVAQNRPKGNLQGLDNIDIAMYSGYKGDPDKFVEALKACKWIKDNGNGLEIQDWKNHQSFAYYSQERSEIAKQNIAKRWERRKGKNTNGIQTVYGTDTPLPTPTPTPTPIVTKVSSKKLDYPYQKIISYLNNKTNKNFRHTSKETQRLIKARINQGFTFADFQAVIDRKSEKWLTNPDMVDYLRPQTLFGTKFESYLNETDAKPSKKILTGKDALEWDG